MCDTGTIPVMGTILNIVFMYCMNAVTGTGMPGIS